MVQSSHLSSTPNAFSGTRLRCETLRRSQIGRLTGFLLLTLLALPAHSQPAGQPTPAQLQPQPPAGEPAGTGGEEPPPAELGTRQWCALPLCREAEVLRSAGDLRGALKLYRYIQEEVDVDDKVVRKPLLWFPIAALYGELHQLQEAQEALHKYEQYIAKLPPDEIPIGQRKEDIDHLAKSLQLRIARMRVVSNVAGIRVVVDDKEIGTTPLVHSLEVPSGRHRFSLRGSVNESQDMEVAPGQEVVVWPMTRPDTLALSSRTARERPRWRIGVGAAAIGVGVTLFAVGAAVLAEDGQCLNRGPTGDCVIQSNQSGLPVMRVVDTTAAGGGMIATGLLLGAAGGILLALPAKRHPVRVAVDIRNNAARLGLQASF